MRWAVRRDPYLWGGLGGIGTLVGTVRGIALNLSLTEQGRGNKQKDRLRYEDTFCQFASLHECVFLLRMICTKVKPFNLSLRGERLFYGGDVAAGHSIILGLPVRSYFAIVSHYPFPECSRRNAAWEK